ncbi:MAG: peptide deformylase [bacterium]|nr:peptide deformylase [bacterium]
MKLEIRIYPDSILKQKAEEIEKMTPEIKELILQMKETMTEEKPVLSQRANGEGKVKGVGLAGNQVGILKRVIVVLTKKGLKGFINPRILKLSKEKEIGKEGCLSLPGLWLEIKRPTWVEVKAINEEGQEIEFKAEGFLARIFQHEIDHLDGILFFERLGFFEKLRVKRKLNSRYAAT